MPRMSLAAFGVAPINQRTARVLFYDDKLHFTSCLRLLAAAMHPNYVHDMGKRRDSGEAAALFGFSIALEEGSSLRIVKHGSWQYSLPKTQHRSSATNVNTKRPVRNTRYRILKLQHTRLVLFHNTCWKQPSLDFIAKHEQQSVIMDIAFGSRGVQSAPNRLMRPGLGHIFMMGSILNISWDQQFVPTMAHHTRSLAKTWHIQPVSKHVIEGSAAVLLLQLLAPAACG